MITLPQQIEWTSYQLELDAAAKGAILNFRVPRNIKNVKAGDRCYVVWRGKVRGYHIVSALFFSNTSWICSTTGGEWPAGQYVQRSGKFFEVDGEEIKGFQGIRRYKDDNDSQLGKPNNAYAQF
jgi:hypothetical protein